MANYHIHVTEDNLTNVTISSKLAKKFNVSYMKHAHIRFGMKVAEANVVTDRKLDQNEIHISKAIIEKLRLPLDCSYNITINDNEWIIGPLIGLQMGTEDAMLIKKLRALNTYTVKYSEVNGVLFAFSTENVDKVNMTVKGYFYNPKKDIWESATLPLPSSIFNRNRLDEEWREYFASLYGPRMFNYKSINKRDMTDVLLQFPEIADMIPTTIIYTSTEQVVQFINDYHNVYIKPIGGRKGLGIFNVEKVERTYIVRTRDNKENLEWTFPNEDEFVSFIDEHLVVEEYMIQETVDIIFNNKAIDFRVGMDKDQHGNWKQILFVARMSEDNSIVSNRAAGGGRIESPEDVLKETYKMAKKEVRLYKRELITKATTISEKLELTGLNFGKLAFDLAIDKQKRIWLIEVNNEYPDDSLANPLDGRDTFYYIRFINLMYAKKLALFEEETNADVFTFSQAVNLQESSSLKRYRVCIAVPLNRNRETYMKSAAKAAKKRQLVGKMRDNANIEKIEVEIEGQANQLADFINDIKGGPEHVNKNVMAVVEIPPLNCETSFVLQKQPLPIS